jgi:hypothetical protein
MARRFLTWVRAIAALAFVAVGLLWLRLSITGERPALYVHLSQARIRLDVDWRNFTLAVCPAARWDRTLPMIALYDINPFASNLRWARSEVLDAQDGDHWTGNLRAASFLGFSYLRGGGRTSYYYAAALCPTWFIVLLFGLPLVPMIWRLRRQRRRFKHRLCLQCGYDLRAAGDRCPECGALNHPDTTIQSA